MADQGDVDLDSIIDRLLEVRGSRPGKQVQLLESEIRHLCTRAREIFISQPILLELEAPIKVCCPSGSSILGKGNSSEEKKAKEKKKFLSFSLYPSHSASDHLSFWLWKD